MSKDYSPFTPGVPVPIESFVGRAAEVTRLKDKVAASTTGRLEVGFLSGERGIGKSSLASFLRRYAEREEQVLGVHTFLGGVVTLEEMVRRVFDRLLKDSIGAPWQKKVEKFFGKNIRTVGLFGVTLEFEAQAQELRRLVHDFAPALRNLLQLLKSERAGLLLLLDDLNGLATSEEFANWLKSLVDEIATSAEPLPLCLLCVGLEERRQSLIKLQPSLSRVFDLVEIRAWSERETEEFYSTAFDLVGTKVEPDAMSTLVRFTGGLPVFAHEIGDAVFKVDDDKRITKADTLRGIARAVDIIGKKHLEPQVLSAIRSERYRTILKKLATLGESFERAQVQKVLDSSEIKVFDNFLRRMVDLGVVTRLPERGPGAYRFVNLLHYLYFDFEAAGLSTQAD